MSSSGVFTTGSIMIIGIMLQIAQLNRSMRFIPFEIEKWWGTYPNHGNWWPPREWPDKVGFLLYSTIRHGFSLRSGEKLRTYVIFFIKERTFPPFALGCILLVGSVVYGALEVVEGDNSLLSVLITIGKVVIFGIIIIIKGFLSALVAAGIVAYAIFHFIQQGELLLIPVFNEVLAWVFDTRSTGLYTLYSLLWVIVGSYESWTSLVERKASLAL